MKVSIILRVFAAFVLGIIMLLLLSGCSEGTITYKEKDMPVSEAEERIADELEVENPDLDLEVNITEESDD
jgi:hypothetical protein